jgi:hypothetical protein
MTQRINNFFSRKFVAFIFSCVLSFTALLLGKITGDAWCYLQIASFGLLAGGYVIPKVLGGSKK